MEFEPRIVSKNSLHNCGERFCISFRKTRNINETAPLLSPAPVHYRESEISFGSRPCKSVTKNVSLLLGASILKNLDPVKLGKANNECYVRATGGNTIPKISKELDAYYEEHGDNNVVKVFVACGVNDIRYCTNGIYHFRSRINQLVDKINLYFPRAKVFFQSILPVFIENRFTVMNILNFNRLLYEVCLSKRCYYLDAFRHFLSPCGNVRNAKLYTDKVHLNKRGMAVLARIYIEITLTLQ